MTATARVESIPYLSEGTVVKDTKGTEYLVTKVLRVNVHLMRLSDGASLQGKPIGLTYVREPTEDDLCNVPQADERVRLGAVVTFKKPTKVGSTNYTTADRFVVFKEGDDKVNIIKLGGDPSGRYLRVNPVNLTAIDL